MLLRFALVGGGEGSGVLAGVDVGASSTLGSARALSWRWAGVRLLCIVMIV